MRAIGDDNFEAPLARRDRRGESGGSAADHENVGLTRQTLHRLTTGRGSSPNRNRGPSPATRRAFRERADAASSRLPAPAGPRPTTGCRSAANIPNTVRVHDRPAPAVLNSLEHLGPARGELASCRCQRGQGQSFGRNASTSSAIWRLTISGNRRRKDDTKSVLRNVPTHHIFRIRVEYRAASHDVWSRRLRGLSLVGRSLRAQSRSPPQRRPEEPGRNQVGGRRYRRTG